MNRTFSATTAVVLGWALSSIACSQAPVSTSRSQIRIVDVGHGPLASEINIRANRTNGAWHVSYACVAPTSAPCTVPSGEFDTSSEATTEVDQILLALREGNEPDGQQPVPEMMGGMLLVSIDDGGFKRDYRREGPWGKTFGRLEELLTPYVPPALTISLQREGQECSLWTNDGNVATVEQLPEIARNWPSRRALLRRTTEMPAGCGLTVMSLLQELGFNVQFE